MTEYDQFFTTDRPVPKEPQIRAVITENTNQLGKSIEGLYEVLVELEDRLAPLLAAPQPEPVPGPNMPKGMVKPPSINAPLADELSGLVLKVDGIAVRIERLKRRLQV